MFLLPLITAALSRISGSSSAPRWLPATAILAIILTACAQPQSATDIILYAVFTYTLLQTGHGNFWLMKGINPENDQPEKLEEFIRPLAAILKVNPTTPLYSWMCMGTKGLGIALPLGILPALAYALLLPLAYHINFRLLKRGESPIAEILSGLFLGATAYATLLFV